MGRSVNVPRPVARSRGSFGFGSEAAHKRAAWIDCGGCNIRSARDHGRRKNSDYRYTWIRDASFTLYALIRLGFVNESKAFNKWLEDRCRELGPSEALQIMFGVDGRRHLPE